MTELRRPLSEREWQVARLVGKGKCYKDIGRQLGISDGTARVHVNNIAAILPSNGEQLPAYRLVMLWIIRHDRENAA